MRKESLLKPLAMNDDEARPEAIESLDSLEPSQAREPLPTLQSFCQTKTFSAKLGVNPLVAGASALFALVAKLRQCQFYCDIDSLRQELVHEIKAFECTLQTRNYQPEQILIARYAICATLDETIQSTSWGRKSNWHEQNLLYHFQGEMWGGERFFLIVERLKQDARNQIDLVEFIYICLSMGFEGKYRVIDNGRDQLANAMDDLYHVIRQQRGDFPTQLARQPKRSTKTATAPTHTAPKLWVIGACTAAVIAGVYLCFSYLIGVTATPLANTLTTMNQTTNHEFS